MNRQFAQRNENATAFVNPEGRIVVAKILPDGPQINIRSNQVRQEILNTVDNMGMEP
jgi:hypothetical protein